MSYDIKDEENKSKKKTKRSSGGKRPTFDFDDAKSDIDRFFNKDQNFSITWYSSLKDYYNDYLKDRLALVDKITGGGKKGGELTQKQAQELMKNPCFLIAHELFDALPIHQFHLSEKREWCEKVVQINEQTNELEFQITEGPTENTVTKL